MCRLAGPARRAVLSCQSPGRRASGGGFVQPTNAGHEIQELARRHIRPGGAPSGKYPMDCWARRLKTNVDAINQRRAGVDANNR